MIWRNPFLAKNSEYQSRANEFLSLFDSTVLEMVNEQNFSGVSYFSSTPGAGKTSLFRAFESSVLNEVVNDIGQNNYKELIKQLTRLQVIRDKQVLLTSAYLSFARNYSILDEMFQNGRRQQVFFALLNYRIAITFIRAIGLLADIDRKDYGRISFRDIPTEMEVELKDARDGKSVYEWACEGEKQLCHLLDRDKLGELNLSFMHTSLLVLKLFEPENVLIDRVVKFEKSLMIFDDFHKLTNNQKKAVSDTLYTLKSNVGIWLGQRLEGLNSAQLVSMDGSLGRDYNVGIIIDSYWHKQQNRFYAMLENIADRRVKEAGIENISKFKDCIEGQAESKKFNTKLKTFIEEEKHKITASLALYDKYRDILEHIETEEDLLRKAIYYECIVIKENRNRNVLQPALFNVETEDYKDFVDNIVKPCEAAARFYLFFKLKLPFYYGINNLFILSSYNVEQFLNFAGAYFDSYRVKMLERNSKRHKKLSIEEQDTTIKTMVKRLWNDMDFRYTNIKHIKAFLDRVSLFCVQSRDEERASYAGGSYTGFAIKTMELRRIATQDKYKDLVDVLAACLSSKYLERKELSDGEKIVFYLNRWLCVYYDLPLAYGGWKNITVDNALNMCKTESV